MSLVWLSASAAETERLGAALGSRAFPGMVLCLDGPLGAGKTVLSRGLAQSLGVTGRIVSPTYQLVAIYDQARLPLWHADLYRLSEGSDLDDLGLDEAEEGVLLVEWSCRSPAQLPVDRLEVQIAIDGEGRRLSLRGTGPRHRALVEALSGRGG